MSKMIPSVREKIGSVLRSRLFERYLLLIRETI
jgi:hypothetical protein